MHPQHTEVLILTLPIKDSASLGVQKSTQDVTILRRDSLKGIWLEDKSTKSNYSYNNLLVDTQYKGNVNCYTKTKDMEEGNKSKVLLSTMKAKLLAALVTVRYFT